VQGIHLRPPVHIHIKNHSNKMKW